MTRRQFSEMSGMATVHLVFGRLISVPPGSQFKNILILAIATAVFFSNFSCSLY